MIETGIVDTWFTDLTIASSDDVSLLDAHESARAVRFVFERDRRRYVRAHAALRRILASYLQCEPAAVRFGRAPGGKPALLPDVGVEFNLSHSGDAALVAVAATRVGADIEGDRAFSDAGALAARNFTPAEQAELAALPVAQRDRAFLVGWTRKEACLKAIGAGLQLAPDTLDCGLSEAERRVHMRWHDADESVVVRTFTPAPHLVGAIALAVGDDQALEIRAR